ncbi:uncharacterized protein GGS22DRAFT_175945 [Annulohypoxylon maeteangense]|uniref:uncharacterized protein n=1 Tax=Annulohypoxylon maeteangense TaxID=1927788 RepID=UPI00200877C2|nr:uncharacterized protein GGS22DRAFT_175945 [Annulohypoxylon maeteangense]KAI0880130.1 hypothetical protein GGS22DRAFT_175945 [Annulohypoxylon maeteangense]
MTTILSLLANAELILLATLETGHYKAYYCFPSCVTCSKYSCRNCPCYRVVSSRSPFRNFIEPHKMSLSVQGRHRNICC